DVDVRIERVQPIFRGLQLGAADVGRTVQDLALQVAEVDDVEVDDAERADAGGGEIHGDGRSESAGADAENAGRLQLALTLDADLGHDEVARVTLDLIVREGGKLGFV